MAVLTPEQAKAFLEAAHDMRFEALFVLALLTGMRQGELLALQWSDVDLDEGFLQVRTSLYYADRQFVFTEPKTNNSRRTVVLPKLAIEALRRHRARLAKERLALGAVWSSEYDLVFPNTIGNPMDPNSLRRREFQAVLNKAGLPRIRFHDLRHTAATLLFAQLVNPKIVSEMLGHSDIAITLGLYGHVTPPMHQQAADTVDKLFQEQDKNGEDKGSSSGLA
jgi:integrase